MKIHAEKPKQPQSQPSPGHTTLPTAGRLAPAPHQDLAGRKQTEHQLDETKVEDRDISSGPTASPRYTHDFSRIRVHSQPAVGLQAQFTANGPRSIQEERPQFMSDDRDGAFEQIIEIQKKSLGAGDPNDADEKEADQVSQRVVQGHSAEVRGTDRAIHRRNVTALETSPEFKSRLENSKGGGQPLDEATRSQMESKMGANFSRVRVHTANEAHTLSESIHARAFAHGSDIYFKQGEFNPTSKQGKELLAHELVHTCQQENGLRRAIQRKGDKTKWDSPGATVTTSRNIGKKMAGLLAPSISSRLGRNVTVGAEISWEFVIRARTSKEVEEYQGQLKAQFLNTESKVSLEEYFCSVAANAFEANFSLGEESGETREPGFSFETAASATVFEVELKWKGLEFKPFEFSAKYKIDKDTIKGQPKTRELFGKSLVGLIETRDMSAAAALKVFISVGFESGHSEKSKKKTASEEAREEHRGKEKEHRREANETKRRKNEAKAKRQKLENKVTQKRNELKRLQKGKGLTPGEADAQINALEKEIADEQLEADKFKKAWEQEKRAMDKALESARAEEKAAKQAGREAKQLGKEIQRLEQKSGRLKKLLWEFEDKLEQQRRKIDKILHRVAEKAAKWIEEKAVRLLGRKAAIIAAKVVAKIILHAIPIISQLLFLWDVATLLWDIGWLIWNKIMGKEGEGESEGESEGKSAQDAESENTKEASGSGTASDATDPRDMPEGAGGQKKGGPGTGTVEKDTGTSFTDNKGKTVTPGEDNPPIPTADTAAPVKAKPTLVMEKGEVQAWEKPPSGATKLHVEYYGAVGLPTGELDGGQSYFFGLVIYYKKEDGKTGVIEPNEYGWFKYVGKDSKLRFTVDMPFIIKTNERRIFFDENFPVSLRVR